MEPRAEAHVGTVDSREILVETISIKVKWAAIRTFRDLTAQ